MLDVTKLTWQNDNIPQDYAKQLRQCRTLDELKALLDEYKPLAADAWAIVQELTEADAVEVLETIRKDSEATPMTENRELEISMPKVMFDVTLRASTFKVPFGAMFKRMVEVGIIKTKDGIAALVKEGA